MEAAMSLSKKVESKVSEDRAKDESFTEAIISKYYLPGALTTFPKMIANSLVSVNLSAIPNDLVNLHRAARSACMAVMDLAPGFSGRSKESLWNKEKIPAEIFSRIVQFAMTADESRFEFSDKVREFRPNVATGLLTVSREVSHEAQRFLYSENEFVFSRCGTDLGLLAQQFGTRSCRTEDCEMGSLGPCVKNLIFEVGHDQSPDKGQLLTETFSATLRGLRRRIRAENLVIALQDNCWGSTEELQDFTDALANVQVAKSFELSGSAFHLYLNMRSIPQALAMKVQPDKSTYQGSTAVDARGYFCDNYSSTKILAETDPTGKDIVDATAKQIRYLAAQIPPV